ncbi:hypothetical protein HG535_0H00940 [Zygotorulaspora mrakii]|uniref:TRIP4/RQT4 C2HC5-type zinc finger domain-containing protein n=1 Tax=Zygotorulaspora mrakii TaxID=42260 RepID=A0A7H9B7P4_ZYGMR|nr:uncharacterized protein HG535_0H00940 [Zygotorulaspora mrakii]QLG74768.1 hypothetical protein HG535_0H00940 [Zygotorulaspora mrakii]
MTRSQAIEYAVRKIPGILPLDESDVRALCEQVLKCGKSDPDAISQGFLDILGHEEAPFEFVIKFHQLLSQKEPGKDRNVTTEARPRVLPTKVPNGDKIQQASKKESTTKKHGKSVSNSATVKPLKESKQSKAQKQKLLEEIDEAWKFLELEHNEQDSKKYICNCQGKRYPLFELAPNCLSCGKIICVREGLHLNNCSFCGQEILPLDEKLKIIQSLRKEKNELNNGAKNSVAPTAQLHKNNARNRYANSYKIASGMGTNLFLEQDKLFDLIERQQERERKRKEVLKIQEDNEREEMKIQSRTKQKNSTDAELWEAQERLEKLLHFQDTSAERTKIIDNASDFSISHDGDLWGSAEQRALMIKKQQRNLRKFEKLERERNGKRDKYVVSMNIGPDGKVTMNEVSNNNGQVTAHSDDDLDEISDEEDRKDLLEMNELKNDIKLENAALKNSLQSTVWDYKKYGKQFETPRYVDSSTSKANYKQKNVDQNKMTSRIQIDDNDHNFWDFIA